MPSIVYVCSASAYSLYFANCLVRLEGVRPLAIVLATGPPKIDGRHISGAGGFLYLLRRVGWRYFLYCLLALVLPTLSRFGGTRSQRLWSFSELCRSSNIELIHVNSLNSSEFRSLLARHAPCAVVSMYLAHILNKRTLDIPNVAFLNLHPSKLPNFRGADPIVQFLRSNHAEMGLTLHRMVPGIDEGPIVAYRPVDSPRSRSALGLMIESARVGAALLAATLPETSHPIPAGIPQDDSATRYGYSSLPTSGESAELRSQGHKLVCRGDALQALRLPRER